eukprot:TRINITY_DN2631_c0_g1_i1.p1 TRINITY_DN2631_c0_g1~~TRINITY_DN2631_c0_g1_i1.p1  ORF type:complete len:594 (+),score=59.06 TRINITY_DN2631_c0_g1_i1:977-2758(+)
MPTALHLAVSESHTAVVQFLLSQGASTRITQNNGKHALHIAIEKASVECTRQLILWDTHEHPDTKELYIHFRDDSGRNCYQIAKDLGKQKMINLMNEYYRNRSSLLKACKAAEHLRVTPVKYYPALREKTRVQISGSSDVLYQVQPKRGRALLFNHDVKHEGLVVESGTKYIMRTEIVFHRIHTSCDESWKNDPDFLRCIKLYEDAEQLELQGQVEVSCSMQLQALMLQANKGYSIAPESHTDIDYLGLNEDIWAQIFSYLNIQDICSCAVNNNMNKLAHNDCVWRTHCMINYPQKFHEQVRLAGKEIFVDWCNFLRNMLAMDLDGTGPLVIDVGHQRCKYGHGKGYPRVIQNRVQRRFYSHNSVPTRGADEEWVFGTNGSDLLSQGEIGSPYSFSALVTRCYREAGLNQSRQALVLSEAPGGIIGLREYAQSQHLIRKVEVVPQAVLTLYASIRHTGIVIHLSSQFHGFSLVVNSKVERESGYWRYFPERSTLPKFDCNCSIAVNCEKIAEHVVNFIKSSPVELQPELWKNVAIDGGHADYENWQDLTKEIKLRNSKFVGFLEPDNKDFNSTNYPILGGNIYATTCLRTTRK